MGPAGESAARTELERRAQALLAEAIDLPAGERGAFLDAACVGDGLLRAEVEALLAWDAAPAPRLERIPAAFADGLGEAVDETPGSIRGDRAYRLVAELGRGGMGVVHLAERADGEFRQQVAIKLLAAGPSRSEALRRRFRTERQILAALDHPGIAKLLDGGTLADGTPFLVMEYVQGERIDDYCRARSLAVAERVRLFVRVCAAVEAAHQRLIVHRDLKPGNVLVTSDGQPKLLDFGIAKLLDAEAADWTVAETEHGVAPLTPRYASPEQMRGEAIGTACDVYSLGVLLYELLAGRSPYEGRDESAARLARAICEEEAPEAGVDRDLEAILARALRKEPGARYPSVAAFAADLERFLDGMPVEARQGTTFYRVGKFARRHRWSLAAGTAFVALLAGSAAVGWWQARALAAERDRVLAAERRAVEEAATARAATDFLVDTLREADPERAQGREPTLREALDRGAARIDAELAGRPTLQATLLEAIGAIYRDLGDPERSRPLLERALTLRAARRQAEPVAYAEALSQLAQSERAAGDSAAAVPRFRAALALREEAGGPAAPDTLEELNRLAIALADTGAFAEAEPLLERALELRLAQFGFAGLPLALDGRSLDATAEPLVRAIHGRGVVAYQLGQVDRAAELFAEALRAGRLVYGPRHTRVATTLTALASARIDQGDPRQALALLDEALAIRRAIQGEAHPDLASVLVNRSAALQALGRYGEVAADAAEAERILLASVGADHPYVMAARNNQAEALARLGRPAEALALHRRTAAELRRIHGGEHPDLVPTRINIGDLLRDLGRREEARREHLAAHELALRLLGADHPLTREAASRLDPATARGAGGSG